MSKSCFLSQNSKQQSFFSHIFHVNFVLEFDFDTILTSNI